MAADNYSMRIYTPGGTLLKVQRSVRSARYRMAENEVGDFEVTVPWGDGSLPEIMIPSNLVEFWRNDAFVFGGYIRRQSVTQDSRVPFYTVSGPDYKGWLADSSITSATGTGDVTFASDALDDVIKGVVRTHVLDTNTKFVCATDSGLSGKTEAHTSTGYETALETIQAIADRSEDTSFDIVRDTDGVLRFRTYTPSRGPDKSIGTASPVLFDLRGGNLKNAEWVRDGNNVVNALRGGGPGDKAARYIWPPSAYATDAASILEWGRIEGFFDAGTESTVPVEKKTQEELTKLAKGEESVNFQISQFGRYTYGVDFDFGTRVTVIWQPVITFTDTIKGIEVKLDEGMGVAEVDINIGDTLTGDEPTRAAIRLGRFLRKLRQNISVQTRH